VSVVNEDGDLFVVAKTRIARDTIERSSTLQALQCTHGASAEMPFDRAVFHRWLPGVLQTSAEESWRHKFDNLQVRMLQYMYVC
jgi:hypothetical protein